MANLLVQLNKKNVSVWSAKFREKIPISNLKTAQFKGSFNRSSPILTVDTKQRCSNREQINKP